MAEGVRLNAITSTGKIIWTDELSLGTGLAHVQRLKLGIGTTGAYADVHAGNPLPTTVSGITKTVTTKVSGKTITQITGNVHYADYDTATGGVQTRLALGIIVPAVGGATIAGGTGRSIKVGPSGTAFPTKVSGNIVGITNALPAGANTIGAVKVSGNILGITTALPAGGNTVGAVKVSGTVSDNIIQIGGSAITLGQKTSAASLPTVPASDWVGVDATFKALRVTPRPLEVLGVYAVNGNTSYTTTTANTILFSFRWGDATRFALILKVEVHVVATAFTTAGLVERQLIAVRSFTGSDTGGNPLTPTANNQKLRTSFGTSLATGIRVGTLTAGTGTADANPLASVAAWMAAIGNIIGGARPVTLLDATAGFHYPLVLAQNEGFRVRFGAAETASTRQTFFNIVWAEANAY